MNIRYPIYEGVYRILTTEGGKQKEPSRKTALFCKVPLDFVWQLCFMVKYCQDTRKLSMQKSMTAATRRQAIR